MAAVRASCLWCLGHEAAGEVVRNRLMVSHDLSRGRQGGLYFRSQTAAIAPVVTKVVPRLCEPGAVANLAGTLLSGARRLRLAGQPVNHHLGVSGFAEYAVVSRSSLVKVPPDLPFETAAFFGCAIITGVGAVLNTANVPVGSTVAIVGAGGVGLSCVLGALLAGARRIIVVDLNKSKLNFAQRTRRHRCLRRLRSRRGRSAETSHRRRR